MLNGNHTPTAENVMQLARAECPGFTSIYIGVEKDANLLEEARIKFKNQFAEARRRLASLVGDAGRTSGFEQAEAIQDQIEKGIFAIGQSRGFAVFAGADDVQLFRSARPFEDFVLAGLRPHLIPLIESTDDPTHFFVLAVSQERVRLLQGSRSRVWQVELPDAPQRLEDVAGKQVVSADVQYHSVGKTSPGDGVVQYHGQGDPQSTEEEHTLRFLREIDRSACGVLGRSTAPLVFAGDSALFATYRKINQYAELMTEPVSGNPDEQSVESLHAKAWPVVRKRLNEQLERRAAAVGEAVARDRGSTDPARVIHAASEGRVEHLFVDPREHIWGRFNEDADNIQVLREYETGSEDLKNLAAILTLRTGGDVTIVRRDGDEGLSVSLAAKYRY